MNETLDQLRNVIPEYTVSNKIRAVYEEELQLMVG